jgi:endonuclease/exonuclease/phosphatase family metal-dependent hydrolase
MRNPTLSIASFNLFNLNRPGLALHSDGDGWSPEEYARKIDWTARNVTFLRSDVFGFQELWHGDALDDVMQRAQLGADYDVLVPPTANGTGIVCAAIVAKGLLTGTPEWIDAFPPKFKLASRGDDAQTPQIDVRIDGFSRPVLHFTMRPRDDEADIHVYVCHFKSKRPTEVFREAWFNADKTFYGRHTNALGAALSTIRRTAEATALRMLITEQLKGTETPVIVLGDINDGQHSNTANILTGQPQYLVGDSIGGSDTALYTAQTLQEFRDTRDVYYTHVHQRMRESLDHILVSEQFYDHSRKRRWLFEGMTVNNDHLDFDNHKADGTNDHGIIRAVFKHRPVKA